MLERALEHLYHSQIFLAVLRGPQTLWLRQRLIYRQSRNLCLCGWGEGMEIIDAVSVYDRSTLRNVEKVQKQKREGNMVAEKLKRLQFSVSLSLSLSLSLSPLSLPHSHTLSHSLFFSFILFGKKSKTSAKIKLFLPAQQLNVINEGIEDSHKNLCNDDTCCSCSIL